MQTNTILNIKQISGNWYLTNMGAFHMYPFPTYQDAKDVYDAIVADNVVSKEDYIRMQEEIF